MAMPSLLPHRRALAATLLVLLLVLAILFGFFPRALAYPLLVIFAWLGIGLLYKSHKLHREHKRRTGAKNDSKAT